MVLVFVFLCCTDRVFSELCPISRLSLGMTHRYLSLSYSGLVLKYYQCSVLLHNVETVDHSNILLHLQFLNSW